MNKFKGNVVVLVGASRGIGKQLAMQLAEQGAHLILAARSKNQLHQVVEDCKSRGASVKAVITDVTSKQSCLNMIREAVQEFGKIDTLLYNAGSGKTGYFTTHSNIDYISEEINLNYCGLVYCLHNALPYLKKEKGRVVGVCSMGGIIALPGTAGYNASKHAMRGFLNTLRVEMLGTGITVTTVYLSAVRTEAYLNEVGEKAAIIPASTPEKAATNIIRAAAKRKKEVIPSLEGRLLLISHRLLPGLTEQLIAGSSMNYAKGR
jgi:short-subunit dehydrogenase